MSDLSSSTALPPELQAKCDALVAQLASLGRVAVAFSAGVDSTVVAAAAQRACGDRAVAVTAVSPSLAAGELEEARRLAERIGIRHRVVTTEEFEERGYQQNAGNRCYFCKSELYRQMEGLADELGVDVIVNGANLDDQGDHRPGMVAASEHRVQSPLLEAGFTKEEVRTLARHWELPVWDKPATPCLSSRIAYGVEVTVERVRRIDEAEAFLRERLGLRELRVRLEAGELARIEVPVEEIPRLVAPENRGPIADKFSQLGFRSVTLDLQGFRSGNLNALLPVESLVSFQSSVVSSQ